MEVEKPDCSIARLSAHHYVLRGTAQQKQWMHFMYLRRNQIFLMIMCQMLFEI